MLTLVLAMGCGAERGPETRTYVAMEWSVEPDRALDLLLVVDDSGSMTEEQTMLVREIPRLMQALTTGQVGDREAMTPYASIHAGAISTDMGVAGRAVPSCAAAELGDDGVLSSRIRPSALCEPTGRTDGYIELSTSQTSEVNETLAHELGCVAWMGTGGCGWEQQLEAMLKALSPDRVTASTRGVGVMANTEGVYLPPRFVFDTSGHALDENAGFVRDGSVLAVLVLTDEEDCSVRPDAVDVFDPASAEHGSVDLNLRCWSADVEHSVERYVDGLLALRPSVDRVVYGLIAGVPVEAEGLSYGAMLDHPMMEERLDTGVGNRLAPSCNTANGVAFAPRRMVEVARGLDARGATTVVRSICQDSFASSLDDFALHALSALDSPRCVQSSLDASCRLLLTLPERMRCEQLFGVSFARSEHDREVCEVMPSEARGVGFRFDDGEDARATCPEASMGRIVVDGIPELEGMRYAVECEAP